MRAIVAAAALTLALAPVASAQQVDPRAAELYEEGARAYREGRFDESAILIRRAYEIEPHPILLYNIARALESAGDLPGALEAYEQFLRDAPADAEQRPRVVRRVEVLRVELAPDETPSEPPADGPTGEPITRTPAVETEAPAAWPWVIAGVGVATVGAAIATGVVALDRESESDAAVDHATAFPLGEEAKDFALVTNVLFIAGGAISLAGVILGIVDLATLERSDVEVSIGPGGLALRAALE
jgi:tetratricopeptide (TPR) repeat protein